MRPHARPEELYLQVVREPVEGTCPECGLQDLARYPVLSEGGWWTAIKCLGCLYSADRERGGLFGSMSNHSDLL